MPLTLKDAHYYTRQMLRELKPRRWSNNFVNFVLNARAADFCLPAGSTTWFINVPLGQGVFGQEGPLPIDLDAVKSAKFFSGQLYPLEFKDWDELQTGAYTGSIPYWYYIKTDTKQLTPQVAGSDIQVTDLSPSISPGATFQQVIGVWPIPAAAGQIHVWYSGYHPQLNEPSSQSPIPRAFLMGWAAGAIADCLRNESAFAEADKWETFYTQKKEEYRVYCQRQKQITTPATYGKSQMPWRDSASSSIILVDQNSTMGA